MIFVAIAIAVYFVYKKYFRKKGNEKVENNTINSNIDNNCGYNENTHNINEDSIPNKELNNISRTQGYETSKSIVTETEKKFYKCLIAYCLPKNYTVNMKTRLEDLIEYSKGMPFAEKQKYRGQVKSRHVDFLVVDSELNPIFAIELDDNSHLKQKAIEADRFKDELFRKIGIPLYRIPANENLWNLELDKIFVNL